MEEIAMRHVYFDNLKAGRQGSPGSQTKLFLKNIQLGNRQLFRHRMPLGKGKAAWCFRLPAPLVRYEADRGVTEMAVSSSSKTKPANVIGGLFCFQISHCSCVLPLSF
jgi:hypothetical protein